MMKNKKLISLLFVAIFSLTGCNRKCSKDEFIKLANETTEHAYKKATVTCKGNNETNTEGVVTKYKSDDTYEFTYSNNSGWEYSGDTSSLPTTKMGIVLSVVILLGRNVKEYTVEGAFDNMDAKELTFYSKPLGFRYNTKNIDSSTEETGSSSLSIKMTGPSDSTFLFDNNYGVITKYIEKSDLTMTMSVGKETTTAKSKTNMEMAFKYSD